MELIDLVNCYNFSVSNHLTQIPDCDLRSPALLDLFISSDLYLFYSDFPPLENSDHVVSVSIGFSINSKRDVPLHHIAYDYSHSVWDSLRDHLRDVP